MQRCLTLIAWTCATSALADERAVAPIAPEDLGGVAEASGTGAELALVMALFEEIQPWSIDINAEVCGYIGYNRLGELVRTTHQVGGEDYCTMPSWPRKMVVIASYHTHSTYSPRFDSEIPSSTDIESDEAAGIDGYIATPGGRLWYVDSDAMLLGQICGIGCLPRDPNFVAAPKGTVREVYSYEQILKREQY